jgi:hypothetical protein
VTPTDACEAPASSHQYVVPAGAAAQVTVLVTDDSNERSESRGEQIMRLTEAPGVAAATEANVSALRLVLIVC